MESSQEDLKKFFQGKFTESKAETAVDEFDYLQLKVASKKFYLFNASSFNIYYAIAILVSLALTLTTGVYYLQSQEQLKGEILSLRSEILKIKNDTVRKLKTPPLVTISKPTEDTVKTFGNAPAERKPKKLNPKAESRKSERLIEIDTATIEQIPRPKIADHTINKKSKKTVYVIKQDTIVRYDSVKVKRRK